MPSFNLIGLAVVGGMVLILLVVIFIYGRSQRKKGQSEARREIAETVVKDASDANRLRERIRNMSDDDLADFLRGD